jgi:hypothetical protein
MLTTKSMQLESPLVKMEHPRPKQCESLHRTKRWNISLCAAQKSHRMGKLCSIIGWWPTVDRLDVLQIFVVISVRTSWYFIHASLLVSCSYKYTKQPKAEQTGIAGRAGYREDVLFIFKRLLTLIGAAAYRGDEESVVFHISVPAVSHTLSKNPISCPYFDTTDGIRIPNLKNLRKKRGRC